MVLNYIDKWPNAIGSQSMSSKLCICWWFVSCKKKSICSISLCLYSLPFSTYRKEWTLKYIFVVSQIHWFDELYLIRLLGCWFLLTSYRFRTHEPDEHGCITSVDLIPTASFTRQEDTLYAPIVVTTKACNPRKMQPSLTNPQAYTLSFK